MAVNLGNSNASVPRQGDIVWINFMPQVGKEQSGRRPGLIISRSQYNRKVGLALVCPITTKSKGYMLEVPLPLGLSITGVVLADQVKSFDWQNRQIEYICKAPASLTNQVILAIQTLMPLQ